jgi:DNA-binding transcriptional ArsR family regulator
MSIEARRDAFQAMADPTRRQIIDLISKQPMTLNSIAEKFEISRPAISQHIKVLVECGIIEIEQKGRERYCEIQPQSLIPAFLWIEQLQKQWNEKLNSFESYLNTLQNKNKQQKKRTK